MTPNTVTLKNTAAVEIHDIPAGGELTVRATDHGQPVRLEHRKRLRDGTFEIVVGNHTAGHKAKPAKRSKE